jgi:hypothetical protein
MWILTTQAETKPLPLMDADKKLPKSAGLPKDEDRRN